MVNINMLAPFYITKALLPRLLQRKERSAVLNVSSGASLFPMPGFFTYSISKVFLSFFAQGLQAEATLLAHKIDFLDYTPMGVATKMSQQEANLAIKAPEVAATSSLDSLGKLTHSFGTLGHKIQGDALVWGLRTIPSIVGRATFKFKDETERRRLEASKKQN